MAPTEGTGVITDRARDGVEPALGVVREFIRVFDEAGIRYCHWKSNEHLGPALQGETDLDILVDAARAGDVGTGLRAAGFKRFPAVARRAYPAMDDWLGFDAETGRLVHLHLHYRLILGEPNLKGFRIPWEPRVLSTTRTGEAGIRISDPTMEMLLLLVRGALKTRWRDQVRALVGAGRLPADYLVEFRWLASQCDPGAVMSLGVELMGEEVAAPLRSLMREGPSVGRLRALRVRARTYLRGCRTYGPAEARLRRWAREGYWYVAGINKRVLGMPIPMSRTIPSGGVMIALVGSDGSGKSTISGQIQPWLSWKLSVYRAYLGSGDGPSSVLRWPLLLVHRALSASRAAARPNGGAPREVGLTGRIRRFRPVWALVLSLEKRAKLRRAWRARHRGMIVICDRYPQNEIMGYNDGPLLSHWRAGPSRILRAIARWEAAPYEWATRFPPDLVIKLRVSEREALARKPDMTPEEIARRVAAVDRLSFGNDTAVAVVNADAPADEVLLSVKSHIWSLL